MNLNTAFKPIMNSTLDSEFSKPKICSSAFWSHEDLDTYCTKQS